MNVTKCDLQCRFTLHSKFHIIDTFSNHTKEQNEYLELPTKEHKHTEKHIPGIHTAARVQLEYEVRVGYWTGE